MKSNVNSEKSTKSFDTFVNKVNYWTLIITTGITQFDLTLPEIFTLKLIKLMTKNALKHESNYYIYLN